MFGPFINLSSIALIGIFILLILIIVMLGRRMKRIRVTAGIITVLVEFGLTPEELEAEVIGNLVRLQSIVRTDTEFRSLAEPILEKYLSSRNRAPCRGGYIGPKKIRGQVERTLNYPPPPPPLRALPPPPPPSSWLPPPPL